MLCSSYSGNTEETLAAYDDALERGAPRLVATTGGALAERARRDGVPVIPLPGRLPAARRGRLRARRPRSRPPRWPAPAPSLRDEIEAAAALAEALAAEWGPDGAEDGEAKALARALHGTVPVIVGAELTAPVAYRWKCQINENAGLPAFASDAARGRPQRGRRLARRGRPRPVLRRLPRGPRRAPAQRAALRAHRGRGRRGRDASSSASPRAARRRLERLVSLVLLGDLVSLYLAVLARHRPGRHRADRPPQGRAGTARRQG